MPFEITMPQLGLTMENGTVVEWLVQEGAQISAGQEVFQVETDKSVVAVEARQGGTIARILVAEGQEVLVGTVLAIGTKPGETLATDWQPVKPGAATAQMPEPVHQAAQLPAKATVGGPIQASWKARTLAREVGLDLRLVAGSGPGGRIIGEDISEALRTRAAATYKESNATPVASNLALNLGLDLSRVPGTGPQGRITQADVLSAASAIIRRGETGIPAPEPALPQVASTTPLKGVRKIVSEGMAHSVHTTARVTLFREVEATEFVKLRKRFQDRNASVSYNDILARICAIALREHPEANARLGEGAIEQLDRVNIGLAVDTERGLLVPVIHNADRLSLPRIAAERARLVEAARSGASLPDELAGGTFTITNLGMFGVEGFAPVINLPECCILGVGRIVRKPVVIGEDDTLAVRPMMNISLVFDHRVIDGAPAARFLDRIAQLIEDPLQMLVVKEL
jgi:pyruvate dehydrogenase E2 component (dihydrolipoamide acetyltransferase)